MNLYLTPEQAARLRRVLKRVVAQTSNSSTYGICQYIIEEIEAQSEKKKDREAIVEMGPVLRRRGKKIPRRP